MPVQDSDLEATDFKLSISKDGESAKLTFANEQGREVSAIVPASALPQLAGEVLSKIGTGTVRPISAREMPLGVTFRLVGTQVGDTAQGKLLTLHIEVPDGVRTLPIDLTPKGVADLIRDLS